MSEQFKERKGSCFQSKCASKISDVCLLPLRPKGKCYPKCSKEIVVVPSVLKCRIIVLAIVFILSLANFSIIFAVKKTGIFQGSGQYSLFSIDWFLHIHPQGVRTYTWVSSVVGYDEKKYDIHFGDIQDPMTNELYPWKPGRSSAPSPPKRCYNVTRPMVVQETQIFLPVSSMSNEVYVFSAYYDDRFRVIRILAMQSIHSILTTANELYCHLWYPSRRNAHHARASVKVLPERNNQKFTASYILCPLPDDSVPFAVSVVHNYPCAQSLHVLRVQNTKEIDQKELYGVGICFPPLHSNFSNVDILIENIVINRIFGATRFTFYDYDVSEHVRKALTYFVHKGVVDRVQWRLPRKAVLSNSSATYDSWYFGQMAALNDCLYRNSQKVKYVVVSDLNDFLVPRGSLEYSKTHINWVLLMKSFNGTKPGIMTFYRTFFPVGYSGTNFDDVVKKLKISTLSNSFRTNLTNEHPRNIVDIRSVVTLGLEHVWEIMNGTVRKILTPEEGLLQHYGTAGLIKDTEKELEWKYADLDRDEYLLQGPLPLKIVSKVRDERMAVGLDVIIPH